MWCWFFPRHLLGSHSGKRDGIWICTCTNTDMQEVLKDAHISYITVITSFCSAPLFQCFQPRTCHSPLLQLLFQLDTFFFKYLWGRQDYFHAYLVHTNSLMRQALIQKRTIVCSLLHHLQWRSPTNNVPGLVQVPKPQNPLEDEL